MKVLIDTNVLIDYFEDRKEFAEAAQTIFRLCSINEIEGCISALTIPNLISIMRKELTPDAIKDVLSKIFIIFKVEDLKPEDIVLAADMEMDDFEDALQIASAVRVDAEYIITRDKKDYKNSAVTPISPNDFLKIYSRI